MKTFPFITEVNGYEDGQLDIWDFDDRRWNGRHAPDSLDFEPPHDCSKEALPL